MSGQLFHVREFARRSGVTVRTLHHYDRLGLLKPTAHTESGYRLYGEGDLARLQQIVTLKFIGFSLAQIGAILDDDEFDATEMLRLQRGALEEKRRRLDVAIHAMEYAERIARSGDETNWNLFTTIIEAITMEDNKEVFRKYYSDEQMAEFDRRWVEEADSIRQTERDWADAIKEAESLVGQDPAGEPAQRLAERWLELIERFTLGNPAVTEGLNNLYAESPANGFRKPYSDEVGDFMGRAMAICKARRKEG